MKKSFIENWSFFSPDWVGVDVHKLEAKDGGYIYRGVLNVCLNEGEIDEEMQCISLHLNIFGKSPGYVASNAWHVANSMFTGIVHTEVSLWDTDGSCIAEYNMVNFFNNAFENSDSDEDSLQTIEE